MTEQQTPDPTPPVDDEENDAALPEPELEQGADVRNDEAGDGDEVAVATDVGANDAETDQ